jgi:hypothetical protein
MQPQPQVTGVNVGPPGFVLAQQPSPMMAVPSRQLTTVPSYQHRQSVYLGVTLVVCGTLSIVFNIVDLCVSFGVTNGRYYNYNSLGFVGHGFWNGSMCIIASGFAIGVGRNRTSCQIRASITLCILAACFSLGQLIAAVIGAAICGSSYNSYNDYCCTGSCSYYSYYGYSSSDSDTYCRLTRTLIAMESLLAIMSGVAGIAAIWAAALGCRAACCCNCCCCNDPFPQQFTMMSGPGGVQMMVITTSQQQGPQMVPVAYPPQYPSPYPAQYQPGAYPQPGYQFTAAPPYYPPPSTAIVAPQAPQPYNPTPSSAPPQQIYENQ